MIFVTYNGYLYYIYNPKYKVWRKHRNAGNDHITVLYKYFDEELDANKKRQDVTGFEWYLEHNFFTYDSMRDVLRDIRDTIDAFSSGQENEYTIKLKEKRGTSTYQLVYAKELTEEQIAEYNATRPQEDNTELGL